MTTPDAGLDNPTLKLLQKCKTLMSLKQIHGQILTTGLSHHTYPLSKLLVLSSTICLSYALSVFNHITKPTVFLHNTLISSIITHHPKTQTHLAFSVYNQILSRRTIRPNGFTYPSLFKASGSHPWLCHGRALHAHVLKFLEPESRDRFVMASLVSFYANYGKLCVARSLFNEISQPDLAAWNAILAAYARLSNEDDESGLSMEVLCLFNNMQSLSFVKPNEITLVALIAACTNLGAFDQGIWAHCYLIRSNLKLNHFVGTALIEMYAKCGRLDLAHQLFDEMPPRDTSCYNAMIMGLAIHGFGQKALGIYNRMKNKVLVPDDATFVAAMCACSHAGLVNEGLEIFHSIKDVYEIEPKLEHYGCLVDLLGRAGRLNEAEEWINKMPMPPNAVLWRSLLGAARVHGDLKRGEIALRHLMMLEPENSSNYVLLSNIFADVCRWEDVKRVRKLMKDHWVDKAPGTSIV